ncbi:hypothetical protein ACIGHF_02625 [Stenotrophomonas sp. NPDC077464]|uniref:hypothetical protein n=1 Tax=unclassified Stenotrophomonas TaxID=196198 RepID=UPI0037D31AD6
MKRNQDPIAAILTLADERGLKLDEGKLEKITQVFRNVLAVDPEPMHVSARPSVSLDHADPATHFAAVHDSFTAAELMDRFGYIPKDLLQQSDVAFMGGRRRLRLRTGARSLVIKRIKNAANKIDTSVMPRVAPVSSGIPDDPVDAANTWIQRLLAGYVSHWEEASVNELHSLLQARLSLSEVELDGRAATPSQIRDRLAEARLYEPMRLLIGREDVTGYQTRDRFVGRVAELRALRIHVDAIESQSLSESAHRSMRRLRDAALHSRQPGVLMVCGRGGMGKSALVAKFVLDHALNSNEKVLTLHLDFDKSVLQPCSSARMFLECVRQTRIQVRAERRPMEQLELLEQSISDGLLANYSPELPDLWKTFRSLLAKTLGENVAILVVLDTFEIIQSVPEHVHEVIRFLDSFSTLRLPRLRIVAVGRSVAPELLQESVHRNQGRSITLEPLSVLEGESMADALGHDLLGRAWNPAWSRMIVGRRRDDESRREPLSIRIAVEMIKSTPADSRHALAQQMAEHPCEDMAAFVGALYSRRILNHVRNTHARKLAWPGLVFRRIDLELLETVLGPLCGIAPQHLQEAYHALANEAWIVTRDGEGLRHLSDLRSRTIPLMRRNDPTLFAAVNAAAVRHFAGRLDGDLGAQAEWLYHRLLSGEGYSSVQGDWRNSMSSLLADAHNDFPVGSEAWCFLQAMTATRKLAADTIARFPPALVLEHVAMQWSSLSTIGQPRLSPVLTHMDLDGMAHADVPSHLTNVDAVLRIKTGRWRDMPELNPSARLWIDAAGSAERYLRGRSLQGFSDLRGPAAAIDRRGGVKSLEALCLLQCEYLLAASPIGDPSPESSAFEQSLSKNLDQLVDGAMDQLYRAYAALRHILRPVAVASDQCRIPALRLVAIMERGAPRRTWSAREAQALLGSRLGPELGSRLRQESESQFRLLNQGGSQLPFLIVNKHWIEHFDTALGTLLSGASDRDQSSDQAALRRYAAARHADCLEPLAYAAFRATHGKIPAAALDRISVYTAPEGRAFSNPFTRTKSGSKADVMDALTLADEAGDLFDMAQLFLDYADTPQDAADLDHVLYCLRLRRLYAGEGLVQ